MSEKMTEKTYRIEGLSCTNCAGKFEKNVKQLPGVTSATVNFGASKISVEGQTTIEELEEAGAFENLIIRDDQENDEQVRSKESFIKRNIALIISLGFILVAVISQLSLGEDHLLTKALYILAIIIGGYDLFKEGFSDLIKLDFSMESLMTIAIIGAAFIGEWAEGSIVVILFAISEALERFSMDKARQSIRSLMDIAPKEALIRRNNVEQLVSVDKIDIDDIMIIKPGQKIAMDGLVINGHSSVNQAAITGESVPVEKQLDDEVFAGTLNEEGVLEVKVTKKVTDTTIAKIIHLVEEAQGERAPAQAFVDKFAKYYTPAVCYGALALAILPPLVRLLFLGMTPEWGDWVMRALTFLVISCPCALVISIPLSFFAGIGGASNAGVLVKGSNYLETLSETKYVVFDKTGTMTQGVFEVSGVHHSSMDTEKLLEYAALAECHSSHPISKSLKKAYGKPLDPSRVTDVEEISGNGVTAKVDGVRVAAGNSKLMEKLGVDCMECHSVGTVVHMAVNGKYAGHILISDQIKPHAKEAIAALKKCGVKKTIMLTGDRREAARQVAEELGIDEVHSELLPGDKVAQVEKLLDEKGEKEKLAFVGDGINDAPVLSRADIGIAMGALGSDAAIEAADIVLMDDDPLKISKAIRISRKCLRIVYENIYFAIGVKVVCLILGALGIANMWAAIFADVGVMIIAVLNAIRALNVKKL